MLKNQGMFQPWAFSPERTTEEPGEEHEKITRSGKVPAIFCANHSYPPKKKGKEALAAGK